MPGTHYRSATSIDLVWFTDECTVIRLRATDRHQNCVIPILGLTASAPYRLGFCFAIVVVSQSIIIVPV